MPRVVNSLLPEIGSEGVSSTSAEAAMAGAEECWRQAAECARLSQTDVTRKTDDHAGHVEELDFAGEPDGALGRARSRKRRPLGARAIGHYAHISRRVPSAR